MANEVDFNTFFLLSFYNHNASYFRREGLVFWYDKELICPKKIHTKYIKLYFKCGVRATEECVWLTRGQACVESMCNDEY